MSNILCCMEDMEKLYEDYRASRIELMKELIEVQRGIGIAQQVSDIIESKERVKERAKEAENDLIALKLEENVQAASKLLLDITGVISQQNLVSSGAGVLDTESSKLISQVEAIEFEEE